MKKWTVQLLHTFELDAPNEQIAAALVQTGVSVSVATANLLKKGAEVFVEPATALVRI